MNNSQSKSSLSQSGDDDYNNNPNQMYTTKILMDMDASKQLLLDKVTIYKLMHEIKCEDGKTITSEARMKSLNEIKMSCNDLVYGVALKEFIIRSTEVKWETHAEEAKHRESWDQK